MVVRFILIDTKRLVRSPDAEDRGWGETTLSNIKNPQLLKNEKLI